MHRVDEIFCQCILIYLDCGKNNENSMNFLHARKNVVKNVRTLLNYILTLVDFHQLKLANLHLYKNWYLKWKVRMIKKSSLFAKLATQNNSYNTADTLLKWKKENNSNWVNFNLFILIIYTYSSWVTFNFFILSV